ncbi:hypothetical protein JHK85_028205 [Glycine max]|nr:hypothetical protein JHK85_028205 [Glycine max]
MLRDFLFTSGPLLLALYTEFSRPIRPKWSGLAGLFFQCSSSSNLMQDRDVDAADLISFMLELSFHEIGELVDKYNKAKWSKTLVQKYQEEVASKYKKKSKELMAFIVVVATKALARAFKSINLKMSENENTQNLDIVESGSMQKHLPVIHTASFGDPKFD